MKKKGKVFLISIMGLLLFGCAKKDSYSMNNVEEIPETTKAAAIKTPETSINQGGTLNGVPLDLVQYYISDDHFYDQEELDFMCEEDSYHIRIANAAVSDDLTAFGESFSNEQARVSELNGWIEELQLQEKDDFTYLSFPVKITNTGDKEQRFCLYMTLYTRIADERLVEYGLSDKYITTAGPISATVNNCQSRVDNVKSYYMVDIQPGETISSDILYWVSKENLDKDIYMCLYMINNGKKDKKLNCEMPPTDEKIKFIKIEIGRGTE